MKAIELSVEKWRVLSEQLHNDYPTSVMAVRAKQQRVLGFTTRVHRRWIQNENAFEYPEDSFLLASPGWYEQVVCLDFYNEQKKTFFLIKYGEFL